MGCLHSKQPRLNSLVTYLRSDMVSKRKARGVGLVTIPKRIRLVPDGSGAPSPLPWGRGAVGFLCLPGLDCVSPVTMLGVRSLARAALKLQCVFYTPWPPLGPVSVGYEQQCTRFRLHRRAIERDLCNCQCSVARAVPRILFLGPATGIFATVCAMWPACSPSYRFLVLV